MEGIDNIWKFLKRHCLWSGNFKKIKYWFIQEPWINFFIKESKFSNFFISLISSLSENWAKEDMPKFGTKISAFHTLFLEWNLKTLFWYLESTSLNLHCCKDWCKNKILRFGTKSTWFGYFRAGIWKNDIIFEISTLEIV